MEATPPIEGAGSRSDSTARARVAAVACGCALAASAVYVAVNDPAAKGSRFLPCVFHATTGLWCPGCGITRGVHQLLRGDLAAALGHNLFTPLVVVAIVVAWSVWALRAFGRSLRSPIDRMPDRWAQVLLGCVIVFGVVRNIPIGPFTALAP